MFIGNLPKKYNVESIGIDTNTPPVNANPVNQTFVEESASNLPPDSNPNSDVVEDSEVNTKLDVNANKTQAIYVIAVAVLIGLLVYRSLKKERTTP